ncbi:sodium:proton antiporter, partial [Anaerostipes caccae]
PVLLPEDKKGFEKFGLDGKINLLFLLGVVLVVLASGLSPMGVLVEIYGVPVEGQNLLRDILLLCIAGLSWRYTD